MQFNLSEDSINEPPISSNEENYSNCQSIGYHLFLGYYFSKQSQLSRTDKQELSGNNKSLLAGNSSFD